MHSTHVFKKKKNLNTMTLSFGVMFTGHYNWYYSLILQPYLDFPPSFLQQYAKTFQSLLAILHYDMV